jgi:2-polyprenyl-3-methyl-5-hydroxy-6-metoxy-1,4-benzoquinol methylase
MTDYDRDSWETRWSDALREHGERVAQRPPNAHLVADTGDLRAGRALDAGCGHGAEAVWLAGRGWQVTAVDFSATALAYARARADGSAQIDWVEADLGSWTPEREAYDLVVSLYVHVAGPVEEFVQRMASGVADEGTLFLVGHRPVDPTNRQVQITVEAVLAALDPVRWEVPVAEERSRVDGVDAVVRARRL